MPAGARRHHDHFADIDGAQIGVLVSAHPDRFGAYWTDVATPRLDSIEFDR